MDGRTGRRAVRRGRGFSMEVLTFVTLGLLLGARHALDADHLAAVAALLSDKPDVKRSGLIGLSWGIGHALVILAVGLPVVWLGLTIPRVVARAFEFAVGLALLVVGLSLAHTLIRERWHLHGHAHDGVPHWHLHSHRDRSDHVHDHWLRLSRRPLLVGMCHGLAGSATLVLLVASAAGSVGTAALYLAAFGLGSIAGMVAVGVLISLPLVFSAGLGHPVQVALQGCACLGSIGLGLLMMAETSLGLTFR